MTDLPRRGFLKSAGLGTMALTLGQAAYAAPSSTVTLAVIGTGGMGSNHVRTLAARSDVRIAWVCDVDQIRLANAADAVESATKQRPQTTNDMRRVLDDAAVDAVFIATPDHWHAPAAILALYAGKHVYVEKPCCHNVREGEWMRQAVEETGLLLQVGTQSRSTDCVREAIQRIHEGEIGDVLVAKAWNSQRRGSIGKSEPSTPPDTLDYDTWLGPAPVVPYRKNMLPAIWRWWYDFGCGDIGNDGVHDIDVALWGLQPEGDPTRVTCLGSKLFFDDDQQFPDTQYAACAYPSGGSSKEKQLLFEQRIWTPYTQEGYENGAAFYGTNGYLIMGHTVGWRLYRERDKLVAERKGRADLVAHHTNFLDAVRGETKSLNAPIEVGQQSANVVHLANIAARTSGVVDFDLASRSVTNDPQANALLQRTYRQSHWSVPRMAATS